ncbi:MAG: hypothetical protein EBS82_04270 [Methylocystaceae bacterium]|jgi:hypothetical protein|nr:hypothetical protein [Methylocystaceae bacterium]NBT97126.1 hypothetical protein [Methylocystaceae bacterium]
MTSSDDEEIEILQPATRDAKGRLLPGQRSINPKGRPPIIRDLKEAAKAHTRQALNTLVSVMNDSEAPQASRITAAVALLDRGWGKPQQNIEAKIEATDMAKTAATVLLDLSRRARESKLQDLKDKEAAIIDVTPQSSIQ